MTPSERSILIILLITIGALSILIKKNSTTHQVWNPLKLTTSEPFLAIWGGHVFWKDSISDEFYYLWKELEDIHGWKEVGVVSVQNRTWLMNDTVGSYFIRYFNRIPDLILYVKSYDEIQVHSSSPDWKLLRHPWLFMDDVRGDSSTASILKRSALVTVEHILATYPYRIDQEFASKNTTNTSPWPTFSRTWVPHAASNSFLVEYNRKPKFKIFLTGAISQFYPYRQIALALYKQAPADSSINIIEYHEHPGYGPFTNATQSGIGRSYAKMINQYFAAMTDISTENNIVAKVFEIPVAGALLLLNYEAVPLLNRLGWFENVHYVTFNRTNMEAVFSDVLNKKNFKKYEKIRKTGHQTALELHTTKRRAVFLHNLAMNSYRHG